MANLPMQGEGLPDVLVYYDANNGERWAKRFSDYYAARSWYVRMHRLGRNPQIMKVTENEDTDQDD